MTARARSAAGYSLTELLISMAIMVTVTGAIFQMIAPSRGTARVQPEFADMQQRARVASDVLYKDLVMAGAGPYQGATRGSLANFFAPILPYRTGQIAPDPPGTFRDDAVTIVYVPNTSSQTTLLADLGFGESVEMRVQDQANCPGADPLCGFEEGMSVLIFDAVSGGFDTFYITQVQSPAGHMQHRGQELSQMYTAGSVVTQAEAHTYYHDPVRNQLRHYDGLQTDVPVVDNVVDVVFEYWGDPDPPLAPKPTIGVANCVYDAAGNPRLPPLAATTGSLVKLEPAILSDGLPAWCGGGSNRFDPDLYRVRKLLVRLRVQASDAAMRPTAASLAADNRLAALFRQPGTGVKGEGGYVPDYELSFDVAPRNLNLTR